MVAILARSAGPAALRLFTCTLLALLLVGCSDDPVRVTTGADIDLDALFAPPSAAEIEAVRVEWASRDVVPRDVRLEGSEPFRLGGVPATLRVVSHAIEGGRHYGAVVTADGMPAGSLPVVIYAHGGDRGVNTGELAGVAMVLGAPSAAFAWVVPSFRSETLTTAGGTWPSGGQASPWDRDVDDALTLLGAALDVASEADQDRVGVLGFSRGAGVAMLMGIRDARIDRVVEFSGPANFFGPFLRDVIEEALRGNVRDLPGLATLDARFIQPFGAGSLTVAEVRPELVRRSAVLFATNLPALQIHHGTADAVVDVSQAAGLIETLESMGRGPPQDGFFVYQGGGHNPLTLAGSVQRTLAFLEALSEPQTAGPHRTNPDAP